MLLNKIVKKFESAFTLVEVLVAMLVLAIGLLGLAGMTVVVLRSNILSQQISEATTITGDLMESLKRINLDNLPHCGSTVGTNVVSFSAGDCPILEDSGIEQLGAGFYPYKDSDSTVMTDCRTANVGIVDHTGSTDATYDQITANLLASGSATGFCSAFNNLPFGSYVRYYRTYDPDTSDTDDSERRLVVVVLWKDRFNKWRKIDLVTTRVN